MWYYVFHRGTGQLLTGGPELGPEVADNPDFEFRIKPQQVDRRFNAWDPSLKDFVPLAVPSRRILSRLEFRRRFTLVEMSTLNALRLDQTVPAAVRGQLETLHQYITDASNINLDDPDTVLGVHACLQILWQVAQLAHLATQEQRDARAAEILASATSVVVEE